MPADVDQADSSDDAGKKVNLKNRLTGAVVLIVLGVIILPMIFRGTDSDSPRSFDQYASDASAAIATSSPGLVGTGTQQSASGTREYISKIAPLNQSGTNESGTNQPGAQGTSGIRLSMADSDQGNAQTESSIENQGSEQALNYGWVVRIGTFSEKGNAMRIVDRLQGKGIETRVTVIATDRGNVTRVWVGPFAERVVAARKREQIQDRTGEKGFITAYP